MQNTEGKLELELGECKQTCADSFEDGQGSRNCVHECNLAWKRGILGAQKGFYEYFLKGNRELRRLHKIKI